MEKQTQPLQKALQAILQKRLLFPYLAASLIIIGLTAFFGGRFVEAQQLIYNHSIGFTATNFVNHAGDELNLLDAVVSKGSNEFIQVSLDANLMSHDLFYTIYLLDQDRKISALTPYDERYIGLDMSFNTFFNGLDCSFDVNFSVPFISLRTGQPTAYLTHCNESGGYLVGELNLVAFQENISRIGEDAVENIFIVDQVGNLLAHPEFENVSQHINIGNWQIVKDGFGKDNFIARYWRDGQFWVGITSRILPTNWMVIAEVPVFTVYAPYVGAILVLVLLFIIIFSWTVQAFLKQLQKKLVAPLVLLSASADSLADGNYMLDEVGLEDMILFTEVSRLLINFQKMSRAIQARETLLKENQEQYRRLVEDSPDAILLHTDSIIMYANAAALQMYRAGDVSQMIGKPFIELIHSESRSMVEARLQKLKEMEQVLPLIEQKHVRFDQEVFDAEVITSSVFFAGTYVAQTIIRDITRRKSDEELLKYRATHDSLTDLPNRFLFQDRLQHALLKSKRSKNWGAVLYLDLDNFKSINDAFGHAVGDDVLKIVASSLQSVLREGDTLARLGGDEFVVLLDEIKNPLDAEHVANNMLNAFAKQYLVMGHEVVISFSVGISVFPDHGQDTQILLQSSDAAMYRAKQDGKGGVKFYAPYMREQALERLRLQTELSHALDRDQLFLQYQPQVHGQTGEIVGVEALVRWRHPEFGLVSPKNFIPLAEETGLILPIGEWILHTVCEQAQKWHKDHAFRVAVNLANLQLKQSDIITTIRNVIDQFEMPPELLELELTENIVFQDAERSFDDLFDLKTLGVSLAMDDFGSGFSTLRHLAHIPFDRIKIDKKLISNIHNPKDAVVVSGIIAICKDLGLDVIAEGVETSQQLDFCLSKNCNYFQGWYYYPAVDPSEITKFLTQGVPWKDKSK